MLPGSLRNVVVPSTRRANPLTGNMLREQYDVVHVWEIKVSPGSVRAGLTLQRTMRSMLLLAQATCRVAAFLCGQHVVLPNDPMLRKR